MSTKTMRLPPRRVLTGNQHRSNGEYPDAVKPLIPTKPTPAQAAAVSEPAWSNQLLAGYLAHEFLTNRTLFGEAWEPPARSESQAADSRKRERSAEPPAEDKRRRYMEICLLLKAGETHLSGVVNPSQLAGILKFR